MLRLLWTYLYRCHESMSTTSSKIDAVMKHFFPPNRLIVTPHEEHLQPFTYIVHFVLSRHFDIGNELCLDLLQERVVNNMQTAQLSQVIAPERITIATNAILLSLNLIEREEPVPSWPSNFDFSSIPSSNDYPTSSTTLPSSVASKASWKEFLDRATSCMSVIVSGCYQLAGRWSILDDQWTASRLGPTYDETHNHIIRHHPEGSIAYSDQYTPHISILQVTYQSWPRLLHSSLPPDEAIDMLIRGVIHIEPSVGEAATLALQRFMADPVHASRLLTRFSAYLFSPDSIVQESYGVRIPADCTRLLNLWYNFVDRWVQDTKQRPAKTWTSEELENITTRVEEIQAGALFLLAHRKMNAYATGAKVMRLVKVLMEHMQPEPSTPSSIPPHTLFAFIQGLFNETTAALVFRGLEEILETEEISRLTHWRGAAPSPNKLLRLSESDILQDRRLWREVFPIFVQGCMAAAPTIASRLRESLIAAATRGNQLMQQLAGVTSRVPSNLQRSGPSAERDAARLILENRDLIDQWHMWLKLICATAPVSDSRPAMGMRDHNRARSDSDLGPEQMQNTHDLFWALSKFVDSDHVIFREAAVSCIGSFPAAGYSQLLEDLSKLQSRQHYDDPRAKGNGATSSVNRARRLERFHTALARVYFVTADLLQDQRFSGKQVALTHVLKYIRNMQTLLVSPDNKDRFDLQRLRRYFCGTVERLFYALATLKDSDRFIPSNLYLTLYNMCEEWCQLGKQSEVVKKRLVYMQTNGARSYSDAAGQAEAIQIFQTETRNLSHAAIGAMAAVCVSGIPIQHAMSVHTHSISSKRPSSLQTSRTTPLRIVKHWTL